MAFSFTVTAVKEDFDEAILSVEHEAQAGAEALVEAIKAAAATIADALPGGHTVTASVSGHLATAEGDPNLTNATITVHAQPGAGPAEEAPTEPPPAPETAKAKKARK